MLFNSIAFLLFFPVVCLVFFLIPASRIRIKNLFLLIASYYFYMNWEPAYALLLLTSTIVTWTAAIGISHFPDKRRKKICLVSSLVLNLSILFLFKYFNFLSSNIETALQACGLGIDIPEFKLLLPVGISFYTFQALGYSIDVYRGTTKAERDFATYALFVSFFPQLVAGPIERSNNLLPQFKEQHRFDYETLMAGVRMMVWGYFMKLVLADRCGTYVDSIFNNVDMHNGGSYLLASLLFPFQIYGDFAGYSLIAIGVARVMGFRLMENFLCVHPLRRQQSEEKPPVFQSHGDVHRQRYLAWGELDIPLLGHLARAPALHRKGYGHRKEEICRCATTGALGCDIRSRLSCMDTVPREQPGGCRDRDDWHLHKNQYARHQFRHVHRPHACLPCLMHPSAERNG